MSSTDTLVIDANGRRLHEGMQVVCDPDFPFGVVVHMSDPDGDVDDEGKMFGINPTVYVRWLDDAPPLHPQVEDDCGRPDWDEKFSTFYSWEAHWGNGEYSCDELEVVEGPVRAAPVERDKAGRLMAFEYAGRAFRQPGNVEMAVERQKFEIIEFCPYEPSNYVHSPYWLVVAENPITFADPDAGGAIRSCGELAIDAYDLDAYQGIEVQEPIFDEM
jgi:hypothetical protein